jgi:hypothetical protein
VANIQSGAMLIPPFNSNSSIVLYDEWFMPHLTQAIEGYKELNFPIMPDALQTLACVGVETPR